MYRRALLVLVLASCRMLEHPHARYQRETSEISAALGDADDKHDCTAAAQRLGKIRGDYEVRSKHSLTVYGEKVRVWYLTCLHQGIEQLGKPGAELDNLRIAVARFDSALGLPNADLRIEDDYSGGEQKLEYARKLSVATATKVRGELAAKRDQLETALRERAKVQEQRIALAGTAEAKGWHLAAVAAWATVQPIDAAMTAQKAAAVARVAPLARTQLAVPVAIETGAGATAKLLAALRDHAALRSRVDVRVVDSNAQMRAVLAVGAFEQAQTTDTVPLRHTYVSGRREVENANYKRLEQLIETVEKEAAYNERKAQDVNCARSSECRTRDSRLADARKNRERAARLREEFARERPTKIVEISSVHEYTAQRTTTTLRAKLAVTLGPVGGAPGKPIEGVASVEKAALHSAANAAVQLPARDDPAPSRAELEKALEAQVATMLINGVARAAALTAPSLAPKLADAKDPLEQAHYAMLIGLRTGTEPDKARARERAIQALGTEPAWTEVQTALQAR